MLPLNKIEFRTAEGKTRTLADYAGKVLMIVNVASKCGLTPQYSALEKIYEKYRDQGFMVLGFPANEFAGQEPGTNSEIQEFCSVNYGVQFPIFEKIKVKGEGQHPLYQVLTKTQPVATKKAESGLEKALKEKGLLTGGPDDIKWNFEKFLLNKDGKIVARFAPDIVPDDPVVIEALEKQLSTQGS